METTRDAWGLDGIFGGLTDEKLNLSEGVSGRVLDESSTASDAANDPATALAISDSEMKDSANSEAGNGQLATADLASQIPSGLVVLTDEAEVSSAAEPIDFLNSATEKLTETLRSANGPPAEPVLVRSIVSGGSISPDEESSSLSTQGSQPVTPNSSSSAIGASVNAPPGIHLNSDEPHLADQGLVTPFGSTLSGNGSVAGPVRNFGVISPGNSPGFLQFADLTLERSSTLVIEIGGATAAVSPEGVSSPLDRYDQINVTDELVFGGTLDVRLIDPGTGVFAPNLGDEFDIVTYANGYSGSFDNYEGLVFSSGFFFKPIFSSTKLTLEVVAASEAQPRPVVFIPGFGGSFAGDVSEAGVKDWLLNRGPSPDKLVLEPLSNAYSNLVQSLVNVGYTRDVDLFVANWDWRVPVARQDLTSDGLISALTAPTITDTIYESGVDYLGYWLDRAVETWDTLTGSALAAVDFVTHSTGGLLARSYIQSDAYQNRSYDGGAKQLPQVNQLIQSGVPNQGVTSTFAFLQNDLSDKSASRVLGRVLDMAYDYLLAGEDIQNPDGSIIDHASVPSKIAFIPQYIGTLRDLLAAYDFADLDGNSSYEILAPDLTAGLPSGSIQNDLIYDLNAPAQYGGAGNLYGGVNGFVDRVLSKVTIVYSGSVDMTDRVALTNGFQLSKGLKNEILPFDQLIGNLPDGDWYFDEESSSNGPEGDGTVPTVSAWGTFEGDTRIGSKLFELEITTVSAGEEVDHTGLTNNVYSQRKILQVLKGDDDATAAGYVISDDLMLSKVQSGLKLIQFGIINPVDYAKEAFSRVKDLVSSFGGAGQLSIDMVLGFALDGIQELLGANPIDETVSLPGVTGTARFRVQNSTVELSADLTLTLEDFVHVSGRITFTKSLLNDSVDVATGLDSTSGVTAGLSVITSTDPSGPGLARSADYSMIYNLPVTSFQIAATNINVFAGYDEELNPGTDRILQRNELSSGAIGVWAGGIDVGLVFMLARSTDLPTFDALGLHFVALNATADSVEIVGVPELDLRADNIEVRLNTGKRWASAPLGPPAVVNFESSFTAGYEINTGGDPVTLNYNSPVVGASADRVLLRVSDFVYVSGGFSFNKGGVEYVDVQTGLINPVGNAVITGLKAYHTSADDDGQLGAPSDGSMIWNLPIRTLEAGLSDVDVFVGYTDGAAGVLEAAALNGELTKAELEGAGAIGVFLDEAELGLLIGSVVPQVGPLSFLNAGLLKFTALLGDTDLVELLGVPGLNLSASKLQVRVNQGSGVGAGWGPGFATPVIDFEQSYPHGTHATGDTENQYEGGPNDGQDRTDGYRVATNTSGAYKALYFEDSVIGASSDRVLLRVSDFVYVSGGFSFNKGGVEYVDVKTNLSFEQALPVLGLLMTSGSNANTGTTLAASADGSMIYNLPIQTIELGFGNVDVFVGYTDPDSGILATAAADGELTEAELVAADAIGLLLDEGSAGMLLGSALPVSQLDLGGGSLNTAFLKFFSLRANAATVALIGIDDLDLRAEQLEVRVNHGSFVPAVWPVLPGLFPPPVIDFETSFPTGTYTTGDPTQSGRTDGYRVATGTSAGLYQGLYFNGAIVGASSDRVMLRVSDFVYVSGSFSFNKGGVLYVDVKTNLTSELADPVLGSLMTSGSHTNSGTTLAATEDGSIIFNLPIQTIELGLANVDVFVGYTDSASAVLATAAADGELTEAELSAADAIGLLLDEANLAMLLGTAMPVSQLALGLGTLNAANLKFFSLQASAATFKVIGIPGMTAQVDGIEVRVNHGAFAPLAWPAVLNVTPPPVIDYAMSFPAGTHASPDPTHLTNPADLLSGRTDGFRVQTGTSASLYQALYFDSALIAAQARYIELNLFGVVTLTGSVAFERGPTYQVELSDGTPKTLQTMTIGAANVAAFVGIGGPYWTDTDRDGSVDAGETSSSAVGLHITDLDLGLFIGVDLAVGVGTPSAYVAGKLHINSFGTVNIPGLSATGTLDIELNVGIGVSGFEPNLEVIDFATSFSEAPALFALLDTDDDDVIGQAEQIAGLVEGYIDEDITTVAQLVTLLNTDGGAPDEYLNISEVLAKLTQAFKTSNQTAVDALDVDDNGRLNTGFEINTGTPAEPVVIDFDQFLIRIQLGGELNLSDVFRMNGIFLFEVDSSSLKAFVAANLEIGPDIGSGSKIFNMNALGALVITSDGLAADISISVSIGGALSDFLQLNANARLVLNTTSEDQSITIPAKYVDYLTGGDSIPPSEDFDSSLVSGLTVTRQVLQTRGFVFNQNDGSATYTIDGTAPGGVTPGSYLLATFDADLTILRAFVIDAEFGLLLTDDRFDLEFTGSLELGGFGSFTVSGGAVIDDNGFAAHGIVEVAIDLLGLVEVEGSAELKINTATGGSPVMVNGHSISPNTYKVAIDATVTLFDFVSATGDLENGLENGVFEIAVNELSIDLFILEIGVSGYIRSDGQFSLTGSLSLPDELVSDDGEWGITGELSVSVSNSGFSGHGSVGIIVFGESFNIASADLRVTTGTNGSVYIRAEGPLSVYIEVTIYGAHLSFFRGCSDAGCDCG